MLNGYLRRWIGTLFFVGAGINHFLKPRFYEQIMPPAIPNASLMVALSGVAEIVGGLGLLWRPLRLPARWGLVALLIAIFPANVYMAMHPERTAAKDWPRWTVWARLPLQGVLIAWVWWMTRPIAYPSKIAGASALEATR